MCCISMLITDQSSFFWVHKYTYIIRKMKINSFNNIIKNEQNQLFHLPAYVPLQPVLHHYKYPNEIYLKLSSLHLLPSINYWKNKSSMKTKEKAGYLFQKSPQLYQNFHHIKISFLNYLYGFSVNTRMRVGLNGSPNSRSENFQK